MFTNHRALVLFATIVVALGGCGGASGTPSPTSSGATIQSPAPTVRAISSPTPGPTVIPSAAALPPGYILLEHFGNAPDGTKLADTEARHLWLVKADGSDLHELAPGQPATQPLRDKGPADWSPDGNHIAFMTGNNGVFIYETDVAGTAPRLISTDCAKTPNDCLEFFPAYSPDGKRLAFIRLTDKPPTPPSGVVAIRDLSNGKVTLLESTRQGPPNQELGAPVWSPDGTRLVYFQLPKDADGAPTGSSELMIVGADDTGRHALTTPGVAAGDPGWSPDGSLIVFSNEPIHNWNDAGLADHPDIYVIHPDGTGLKRLTSDEGSGAPSWMPDGRILYFSQRGLWLMGADGSNPTRVGLGGMSLVSATTGYSYYARWQPTP